MATFTTSRRRKPFLTGDMYLAATFDSKAPVGAQNIKGAELCVYDINTATSYRLEVNREEAQRIVNAFSEWLVATKERI